MSVVDLPIHSLVSSPVSHKSTRFPTDLSSPPFAHLSIHLFPLLCCSSSAHLLPPPGWWAGGRSHQSPCLMTTPTAASQRVRRRRMRMLTQRWWAELPSPASTWVRHPRKRPDHYCISTDCSLFCGFLWIFITSCYSLIKLQLKKKCACVWY